MNPTPPRRATCTSIVIYVVEIAEGSTFVTFHNRLDKRVVQHLGRKWIARVWCRRHEGGNSAGLRNVDHSRILAYTMLFVLLISVSILILVITLMICLRCLGKCAFLQSETLVFKTRFEKPLTPSFDPCL